MMTSKTAIIIGCGISGASAADELTKAGYKVIILEKNKRIGGKLKSVSDLATDGYVPELGGVVLTSNYPILDTLNQHHLQTDPVFYLSPGASEIVYGSDNPSYYQQGLYAIHFCLDYLKFALSVKKYNTLSADSTSTADELSTPFSDYANNHGLTHLNRFLTLWIPGMGYGTAESNDTFRILNYMGYMTIPSIAIGSLCSYPWLNVRAGYQSAIEKLVEDKDVRLNARITNINRHHDGKVQVTYYDKQSDSHDDITLDADLLVLTMSPERWHDLPMSLTDTETQCTEQVTSIRYPTAICDIKNFPKQHVFVPEALQQDGFGHIGFITTKDNRDNPESGRRCTVFMNIDKHDKTFSLAEGSEGRQTLLNDLAKLGFHEVTILAAKDWKDYNAALPWDIGMQLEREQGQHHTLYVGSYSPKSFETVAGAESYSRETVQRYCHTHQSTLNTLFSGISRTYRFFFNPPKNDKDDHQECAQRMAC